MFLHSLITSIIMNVLICVCVSAGVRLKLSQEAIAAAQVFYLTFVSVMDQDEYETAVSPLGISPTL